MLRSFPVVLLIVAAACTGRPTLPKPSPLSAADSARIAAAYLTGHRADSLRELTLAEYFAHHDSVAVAANRRYVRLRVF
jgi:hypothetical protein